MAGNISSQSIPAPVVVLAPEGTYTDILNEYPELAADVFALTAWRDVGQPDYKSRAFNRMYPGMKPFPWTAPW